MTASELYELVKDDGGVWERLIDWSSMMRRWYPSSDGAAGGLPSELVELILESAYARAITDETNRVFMVALQDGGYSASVCDRRPHMHSAFEVGRTRLHALVAAYRAGKEKKDRP